MDINLKSLKICNNRDESMTIHFEVDNIGKLDSLVLLNNEVNLIIEQLRDKAKHYSAIIDGYLFVRFTVNHIVFTKLESSLSSYNSYNNEMKGGTYSQVYIIVPGNWLANIIYSASLTDGETIISDSEIRKLKEEYATNVKVTFHDYNPYSSEKHGYTLREKFEHDLKKYPTLQECYDRAFVIAKNNHTSIGTCEISIRYDYVSIFRENISNDIEKTVSSYMVTIYDSNNKSIITMCWYPHFDEKTNTYFYSSYS